MTIEKFKRYRKHILAILALEGIPRRDVLLLASDYIDGESDEMWDHPEEFEELIREEQMLRQSK